MLRGIKLRLGLWISIALVGVLAFGGAVYLGRLYLRIIKEGSVPPGTRVTAGDSKSVVARDEQRLYLLNPIPVYMLQAGVFSTLDGAQEAAKPLEELGYKPYITQSAPYRIWIGVYQKRGDTEITKQVLKDKGVGSFTASVVVNGANLRYGRGSEAFIRETAPLMEEYTNWLKENLQLFTAGNADRLNWPVIDRQVPVVEKVYQNIGRLNKGAVSNDQEVNRLFAGIWNTVGGYHQQLGIFLKEKNQPNYEVLQNKLLGFIDNYMILWQKVDSISKT